MKVDLNIVALHVHLISCETIVLLLFERVVPTTKLMEYLAAEAVLELVETVHRVGRIRIRGDAEHVIFITLACLGLLDGFPLECVGRHDVAHAGRGCAVEVGGAV